jgi:poly(hydroxyalkanoate) granule-associated protein
VAKKSKKKKSAKEIQEEVQATAHQVWLAGLGAAARAQEKGEDYFHQLVEQGRGLEGKSRGKLSELVATARDKVKSGAAGLGERLDERVTGVLHRLGVPNREEIERLTQRVEELNAKVAGMADEPAPAKKPAARKPAAKKASTTKPAAKKPAAKKPAARKPAARKPAAKKTTTKTATSKTTDSK